MKKYILTFCVILTLAPSLFAKDEPVVLSLSAVVDYGCNNNAYHIVQALRPRIVAELVKKYECVVLSRSHASDLAMEAKIARMHGIKNNTHATRSALWSADHGVKFHINKRRKAGRLPVVAVMQDLQSKGETAFEKYAWDVDTETVASGKFKRDNYDEVVETAIQKIVETRSLKERKPQTQGNQKHSKKQTTWAVLPFSYIDETQPAKVSYRQKLWNSIKQYKPMIAHHCDAYVRKICYNESRETVDAKRAKAKLAYEKILAEGKGPAASKDDMNLVPHVETIIQDSQSNIRLVDRASINEILKELNLKSMSGLTEGFTGWLGRIIKADRMLMGYIIKTNAGYDLILQLVDAQSSAIIAADKVSCKAKTEVPDALASMTSTLAKQDHDIPAKREFHQWQMDREGQFHLWRRTFSYNTSHYMGLLDNIEIHLLLKKNTQAELLKLATFIKRGVLTARDSRADAKYRSATLLDHLLTSKEYDLPHPAPSLAAATAYLYVYDADRAMEKINDHIRNHPGKYMALVKYLLAECEDRKENHKKALEHAKIALKLTEGEWNSGYSKALFPFDCKLRQCIVRLLAQLAANENIQDEELELEMLMRYFVKERFPEHGYASYMFRTNYGFTRDAFFRLATLINKREGYKQACKLISELDEEDSAYQRGYIYIYAADLLCRAGRLEDALPLYKKGIPWRGTYVEDKIKLLNTQLGIKEKKPDLRKPSDIMPFPDKYKIYCYPGSNVPKKAVQRICNYIGNWLGTKVHIGKAFTPPAGAYNPVIETMDVTSYTRQMFNSVTVPDDAVLVFFISGETFFVNAPCGFSIPSYGNPVLVDKNGYSNNFKGKEGTIASSIFYSLTEPTVDSWAGWPRNNLEFCESRCDLYVPRKGLCPKCAKLYTADNFDKCHKALQSFLNRDNPHLQMLPVSWSSHSSPISDRDCKIIRKYKSHKAIRAEHPATYKNWDIAAESALNSKKDDPRSQAALAMQFLSGGYGFLPDFEEAFQLAENASSAKDPYGTYALGLCYYYGKGVIGNEKRGRALFAQCAPAIQEMAEQGDPEAQSILGDMHKYMRGVAQNHYDAIKWYKKAADQQHATGQYSLGCAYANGYGTAVDAKKAVELYTLAANQNHPEAMDALGVMLSEGKGCSKNPTKAYALFRKATALGLPAAQNHLGECYENGAGTQQSDKTAILWFCISALNGDGEALRNLGDIYSNK